MSAATDSRAGFVDLEPLGEGPVSVCWRAEHRELGSVALKELRPAFRLSEAQQTLFRSQTWALQRLGHPHIIVGHGLFEDGAEQLWAEELLPGPNLAGRVEDGALPLIDALAVTHQLALAMRAAHHQDVSHGALGPSCVRFADDGRAVLGDFAFPLLELGSTAPGRPTEARLCAAPERLEGQPPSPEADVYGLGSLLVYMLTRFYPPAPGEPRERFERFGESLSGMFPSLWRVLCRLFHPKPRKRPTLDALLEVCEEYLRAELGPSSSPDTTFHRPVAPVSVSRARSIAGSFAMFDEEEEEEEEDDLEGPHREEPKFAIRDRLGAGGMGEVWGAVDSDLRREVAIKTSLSRNPRVQRLFIAEAQITGQLEHPNIVPIHELATDDDGRPFIVMKKVEGDSLHSILSDLRRGRRPGQLDDFQSTGPGSDHDSTLFRDVVPGGRVDGDKQGQVRELTWLLHIFLKICDAISYAHSRGVLHRDLKPANVMVGRFGEALVLDWGLAGVEQPEDRTEGRVVTDCSLSGDDEISDGRLLGTVAYMPPEQARGELSTLDERADVFALGAILYHMVCLRMPRSRTPKDAYEEALAGDVVPPSEKSPERWVPDELEAIVLRAMAPDREQRYRDVRALQDEVRAFLDGRTVRAYSYTRLERLLRWTRRNRTSVRFAALGIVLVICALFGARMAAESARRSAEADALRQREAGLDALESAYVSLSVDLDAAAEPGGAAAERALALFAYERADEIARVGDNDDLLDARPAVALAAQALPARAESLRVALLLREAAALHAGLPPPATADSAALARAEAGYRRFRRRLTQRGPLEEPAPAASRGQLADSLAVARLALWRARVAAARGDAVEQAFWVTEAYTAQPSSEAAGRGFLDLAEASLAEELHARAGRQFLQALRAFDRSPTLQAAAWYGLARAIARLPRRGTNPFGLAGDNRELALRCLLQAFDGDFRPSPALLASRGPGGALEAGLWLEALRRTSVRVEASGILGDLDDGGAFELYARIEEDALEIFSVDGQALDAAEADWRLLRERLSLSAALAGAGFDPEADVQLEWIGEFVPGSLSAVVRVGRDGLLVLSLRDNGEVELYAFDCPEPAAPRIRDVDGDGRRDLIIFSLRNQVTEIMVSFCDADGELGRPQPVRTPAGVPPEMRENIRRFHSRPSGVDMYDLNGDGRRELVIALGEFNHFHLEVWALDEARRFHLVWEELVGKTYLLPLPDGDGRRLVIDPFMPEKFWPFFRIRGYTPPELRAWSVGMPEGKLRLTPFEHPFAERARLFGPRHERPLVDGDLLVLRDGGHGQACFTRIGPDGALSPGVTLVHEDIEQLGPRLCAANGIFRRATRADLVALAARRPALEEPRRDHSERLTLVRFLYDFGLPAEAARVARETLDEGVAERDLEAALQRLELRALLAADAPTRLLARLEATVPAAALADLLPPAISALVTAGTPLPRLTTLVHRWRRGPDLDPQQRSTLGLLARSWAPLGDEPSIDWRGLELSTPDGSQPVAATLVVGEPRTLSYDPEHDAFRFLSTRLPPIARLIDGDAHALPTTPADLFGVPVRFDGGAWRMVCEIQLLGSYWGSHFDLGLLSIPDFERGREQITQGLRISCVGTNNLNALRLRSLSHGAWHGEVRVDSMTGRWVRAGVEYLPAQERLRVVLSDAESGELLAAFSCDSRPLARGTYLLGVGSTMREYPHTAVARLGRVALWGGFAPISPHEPVLSGLAYRFPGIAQKSEIFRRRLAGKRSPELWHELLERTAAALEGSRVDEQIVERTLSQLWFEALWEEGAETFVGTSFEPWLQDSLVEWAFWRLPGERDRLRAAGEVVGRLAFPGVDGPELTRRLSALHATPDDPQVFGSLVLVPMVDRGDVPPRYELENLYFAQQLAGQSRTTWMTWSGLLASWYLELMQRYPDVSAPAQDARVLLDLLRRARALELYTGADLIEDERAFVEEQRAHEEACREEERKRRAAAHAVGAAPAEWPE